MAVGGVGNEPGEVLAAKVRGAVPQSEKNDGKKTEFDEKVPEPKEMPKEPDRSDIWSFTATSQLIALLQERIDTKDFTTEMTPNDFLNLLSLTIQKKYGKDVTFLLDSKAFQEDYSDSKTDECTIKFRPYPSLMSVGTALQYALDQLPGQKAQVLIRNHMVIITTQRRGSLEYLINERITATFLDLPFNKVIGNLADMSGVSINLDPLVEEKANKKISAIFRNDVTLEGTVRIVTEMAGLKLIDMKAGGLYITTSERAKEFEKELRELKK